MRLDTQIKVKLDDEILDDLIFSQSDKYKFLLNNINLVAEIARNEVTESDIIGLAYRKKQLDIFEQLLKDDAFFEATKKDWNKRGKESVWQQFFENNPWIFGYGLNFIFASQLENRKLEQVVSGHYLDQSGKRVDALMRTHGFISSLCFIEIKTHKTSLLFHQKPYRAECWRVSDELAGSVAQIQKTVQKTMQALQTRFEPHDSIGNPIGEPMFLYQPKSYVVIGSLEEFYKDSGINEQKFSSFQLFRRNLSNPEIITFDELFERAKFIVQYSEESSDEISRNNSESRSILSNDDDLFTNNPFSEDDDIPF